jgi:hypothetical protein
MDPFEVIVQGEQFRVCERTQPEGGMSYDFAWLNGPAGGTYGFALAPSSGQIAATELVAQARQFVAAFYGPGGIGETDFPNHIPANEA